MPQIRTKPVVIEDAPTESIDLTEDDDQPRQEHNLDIDVTTPVRQLKPKKKSRKQNDSDSEDFANEEEDGVDDDDEVSIVEDTNSKDSIVIQDDDSQVSTSSASTIQTEPKYFGYRAWKYSLLIFLEPYDPNDTVFQEQNSLVIKYKL